jgi:hypothetical protein
MPAAYTKDGLVNALQDAARNAGISLKKVEIESSEFPFLCGVVCENGEMDFQKLKLQLKQMNDYEYGGCISGNNSYAFNLVPYRAFPPESGSRISHRMTLREQVFFDQIASRRD